jgi:uncharacterized membrane protein YfcA
MNLVVLFLISAWAGVQNALAGGGTFLTLPCLILTGLNAQQANITSTVGLFPAQVVTGLTGRQNVSSAAGLSFHALMIISLLGGGAGAVLLLVTPSRLFEGLVPWLVLFATLMFAVGSYLPKYMPRIGTTGAVISQCFIAVYGGYFGGGIGFLMMAALGAAGLAVRESVANKNMLAVAMNASAVAIFLFSPQLHWLQAVIMILGSVGGGYLGGIMVNKVNQKALRLFVVLLGAALTVGLFMRAS